MRKPYQCEHNTIEGAKILSVSFAHGRSPIFEAWEALDTERLLKIRAFPFARFHQDDNLFAAACIR